MLTDLLQALPHVLQLNSLLAVALGVIGGIFIGALPGLSATLGISVLLPFTFSMSPLVALGMMAGIYNGSMYGGAIPSILLRIPGTPSAVATTFDGYPMAQQGRSSEALQIALFSSGFGGFTSAIAFMLLAPVLGNISLMFGPAEVFWISTFGILCIALLIKGNSIKGLISACIGLFVSTIGLDLVNGSDRFTFGCLELSDGISVIVLLIGLYALPPVVQTLTKKQTIVSQFSNSQSQNFFSSLLGMFKYWKTLLRAASIGIFVGIIPGAGGSFGTFVSYNEAKRKAKNSENWGKGEPEGIVAAETCNNADTASSLIPALTLGIPGTSVAAVMMGGFLIHGLQPGPNLFIERPLEVYSFMWQFLLSSVFMIFLGGSFATRLFAKVLNIPRPMLGGIIFSLMALGAFSIRESMFDVYLMFFFGLLGFAMEELDFPLAPAVLGVILGKFMEKNFRIAMLTSENDIAIFWQSIPARILIFLIVLLVVMTFLKEPATAFFKKIFPLKKTG